MYQNQLFFEDFKKVVKVRIASQKEEKLNTSVVGAKTSTKTSNTIGDFWMKRVIIKLGLQSMLH